MKITNNINTYPNKKIESRPAFRALHLGKGVEENLDFDCIKLNDSVKSTARNYEVLAKVKSKIQNKTVFGVCLGIIAATCVGGAALLDSLWIGLWELGLGAFWSYFTYKRQSEDVLSVQAGEGIKKDVLGRKKLTGVKSEEFILPEEYNLQWKNIPFNMDARIAATKSPEEIKSDFIQGKTSLRTYLEQAGENIVLNPEDECPPEFLSTSELHTPKVYFYSNDRLKVMHQILQNQEDNIAKIHLMKTSNGEYPIHHMVDPERVQIIADALKNKPEVLKEILTARPMNNDKKDLNVVERFINDESLRPIFKEVLGDEFNEYDEVAKEKNRLEQNKKRKELQYTFEALKCVNDFYDSYEDQDVIELLCRARELPEDLLKLFKSGELNIHTLSTFSNTIIPAVFENNLDMLTDVYTTRAKLHNKKIEISYIAYMFAFNRPGTSGRLVTDFLNKIKDRPDLLCKVYNVLEQDRSNVPYEYYYKAHLDQFNNYLEPYKKEEAAKLDAIESPDSKVILEELQKENTKVYISKTEKFIPNVVNALLDLPQDNQDRAEIINLLEKFENIDYNKEDQFGVSVIESVMNAEDSELLDLINKTGGKIKYYPILDSVYENIGNQDFKNRIDKIKFDFPELKEAIRVSSKDGINKLVNQFQSPLMSEETKSEIKKMLDASDIDFQAYVNVKSKGLLG